MGYIINRDGIGPYRIEVLRRIGRGEIKALSDLGRANPLPLLMRRNLIQWRGGRYQLTLDGRMLIEEVAEEQGQEIDRQPTARERWGDRVKGVLPLMPERFRSSDVQQALSTEWTQTTMSYIAQSLRYLERQGLVRCLGRVEKNLI